MKLKNEKKKLNKKTWNIKTNKYFFDFQQFEAIWSFSHLIDTVKIDIDEPEIDQSSLLENIVKFLINLNQKQKNVRLTTK